MKRRWLQFRLQALFWLTLLAAACCALGPPLWRWAEPRLYPNPPVRYLGEVIDYRTAEKIAVDAQFRRNYLAKRRLRLSGAKKGLPAKASASPAKTEP